MRIRRLNADTDLARWRDMRLALWPDYSPEDHEALMRADLARRDVAVFVAEAADGALVGFAEADERPYADGCETSPVAYLEGWWVAPEWRRRGVGRALVLAVIDWARGRGRRELASDALLENDVSHRAHRRLGFEEVDRVVQYRLPLDR